MGSPCMACACGLPVRPIPALSKAIIILDARRLRHDDQTVRLQLPNVDGRGQTKDEQDRTEVKLARNPRLGGQCGTSEAESNYTQETGAAHTIKPAHTTSKSPHAPVPHADETTLRPELIRQLTPPLGRHRSSEQPVSCAASAEDARARAPAVATGKTGLASSPARQRNSRWHLPVLRAPIPDRTRVREHARSAAAIPASERARKISGGCPLLACSCTYFVMASDSFSRLRRVVPSRSHTQRHRPRPKL